MYTQGWEHGILLIDKTDDTAKVVVCNLFSIDVEIAGNDTAFVLSCQEIEESGLACTRCAHDGHELTRMNSALNEVRYLSLIDKKYGLDIEVPGSAILSSFGFNVLALWNDAIGLAIFCGVFLVVGYIGMHVLLVERR